jgi:hypothetical protein
MAEQKGADENDPKVSCTRRWKRMKKMIVWVLFVMCMVMYGVSWIWDPVAFRQMKAGFFD